MLIKEVKKDKLIARIYSARKEMGAAAASEAVDKIKRLLERKDFVNIVFAAAPSQRETLESIVSRNDIDWSRIRAFRCMSKYLSTEEYKSTLAYLEDIKLRLADCRIECADKELLESEIEWSVDYLIHSCRLGIFKTDYKSRSAEKLRGLAEDLECLNKLYKIIWNKRNKLSGYSKSSMRARVLLNKYKAILSYND